MQSIMQEMKFQLQNLLNELKICEYMNAYLFLKKYALSK